MSFNEFEQERMFHEAWNAVAIVRTVDYSLFTFGESVLPYYLVCGNQQGTDPLSVTQGDIRINRPMIVTPESGRPEFQNFFENVEYRQSGAQGRHANHTRDNVWALQSPSSRE